MFAYSNNEENSNLELTSINKNFLMYRDNVLFICDIDVSKDDNNKDYCLYMEFDLSLISVNLNSNSSSGNQSILQKILSAKAVHFKKHKSNYLLLSLSSNLIIILDYSQTDYKDNARKKYEFSVIKNSNCHISLIVNTNLVINSLVFNSNYFSTSNIIKQFESNHGNSNNIGIYSYLSNNIFQFTDSRVLLNLDMKKFLILDLVEKYSIEDKDNSKINSNNYNIELKLNKEFNVYNDMFDFKLINYKEFENKYQNIYEFEILLYGKNDLNSNECFFQLIKYSNIEEEPIINRTILYKNFELSLLNCNEGSKVNKMKSLILFSNNIKNNVTNLSFIDYWKNEIENYSININDDNDSNNTPSKNPFIKERVTNINDIFKLKAFENNEETFDIDNKISNFSFKFIFSINHKYLILNKWTDTETDNNEIEIYLISDSTNKRIASMILPYLEQCEEFNIKSNSYLNTNEFYLISTSIVNSVIYISHFKTDINNTISLRNSYKFNILDTNNNLFRNLNEIEILEDSILSKSDYSLKTSQISKISIEAKRNINDKTFIFLEHIDEIGTLFLSLKERALYLYDINKNSNETMKLLIDQDSKDSIDIRYDFISYFTIDLKESSKILLLLFKGFLIIVLFRKSESNNFDRMNANEIIELEDEALNLSINSIKDPIDICLFYNQDFPYFERYYLKINNNIIEFNIILNKNNNDDEVENSVLNLIINTNEKDKEHYVKEIIRIDDIIFLNYSILVFYSLKYNQNFHHLNPNDNSPNLLLKLDMNNEKVDIDCAFFSLNKNTTSEYKYNKLNENYNFDQSSNSLRFNINFNDKTELLNTYIDSKANNSKDFISLLSNNKTYSKLSFYKIHEEYLMFKNIDKITILKLIYSISDLNKIKKINVEVVILKVILVENNSQVKISLLDNSLLLSEKSFDKIPEKLLLVFHKICIFVYNIYNKDTVNKVNHDPNYIYDAFDYKLNNVPIYLNNKDKDYLSIIDVYKNNFCCYSAKKGVTNFSIYRMEEIIKKTEIRELINLRGSKLINYNINNNRNQVVVSEKYNKANKILEISEYLDIYNYDNMNDLILSINTSTSTINLDKDAESIKSIKEITKFRNYGDIIDKYYTNNFLFLLLNKKQQDNDSEIGISANDIRFEMFYLNNISSRLELLKGFDISNSKISKFTVCEILEENIFIVILYSKSGHFYFYKINKYNNDSGFAGNKEIYQEDLLVSEILLNSLELENSKLDSQLSEQDRKNLIDLIDLGNIKKIKCFDSSFCSIYKSNIQKNTFFYEYGIRNNSINVNTDINIYEKGTRKYVIVVDFTIRKLHFEVIMNNLLGDNNITIRILN